MAGLTAGQDESFFENSYLLAPFSSWRIVWFETTWRQGRPVSNYHKEVLHMGCNNGCGFGGGSCWWIIIILLLCCCCGGGGWGGYGCNNGCGNSCGC